MHLKGAIHVIPVVSLLAVASVEAQRPSTPIGSPQSGRTGVNRSANQKAEPCWEQAGISKAAIEQRRSIQESTRPQIQAVCSEANLSPQQKRAKIREIRQAAHVKINAMISPAERQKLEACQRGRGNHVGMRGMHAGGHAAGSDPCAGLGR